MPLVRESVPDHLLQVGPGGPIPDHKLYRFPRQVSGDTLHAHLFNQLEDLYAEVFYVFECVSRDFTSSDRNSLPDEIDLQDCISIMRSFPVDIFSGHMKVAGVIPRSKNIDNARRFSALTLMYATQFVFEERLLGLENFQASVMARMKSDSNFSADDILLMKGFRALCQVALNKDLLPHVNIFARQLWNSAPKSQRKIAAVQFTAISLRRIGLWWDAYFRR